MRKAFKRYEPLPPVGATVVVCGDHPHARKVGECIGHEVLKIINIPAARIRTSDGSEFFVSNGEHWYPYE